MDKELKQGATRSVDVEAVREIAGFNAIIDAVEHRCLHADGPVTPTLQEMREDELAQLWRHLQAIREALRPAEPKAEPGDRSGLRTTKEERREWSQKWADHKAIEYIIDETDFVRLLADAHLAEILLAQLAEKDATIAGLESQSEQRRIKMQANERRAIEAEAKLAEAKLIITAFIEAECEYMRINNLGDGEKQHNVKRGRAFLASLERDQAAQGAVTVTEEQIADIIVENTIEPGQSVHPEHVQYYLPAARAILSLCRSTPAIPDAWIEARRTLADLRENGWSVAIHNDYRQDGRAMTFWLFTHEDGRWLKGEGASDEDALALVRQALQSEARSAQLSEGE